MSPFGGVLLLHLLLLSPAHAGYWEKYNARAAGPLEPPVLILDGKVWAGKSRLKDLYYNQIPEPGLVSARIQSSDIVMRNGELIANDNGGSSPSPNVSKIIWHQDAYTPIGGNVEVLPKIAPPTVSSTTESSVYTVFKWHRRPISDYNPEILDPNDNPPPFIYVYETITITGYKNGATTAPWSGDNITLSGRASSKDMRVTLGSNWQHETIGGSQRYLASNSDSIIRRYPVTSDTVSTSSVGFNATATLAPGYESVPSGIASVGLDYDAQLVNLAVLARLKVDHSPSNLSQDFSSAASIAAGHLDNGDHIHEADIALQFAGQDNQPLTNVNVPRMPKLGVEHAQGVEKSATLPAAPSAGTTDVNGRIYIGSLLSRDLTSSLGDTVNVQLKDTSGTGATIGEGWASMDWKMKSSDAEAEDQLTWDPHIFPGKSQTVICKARFAPDRPLTNHKMRFYVSRVHVIEADPNTGIGVEHVYVCDDLRPDEMNNPNVFHTDPKQIDAGLPGGKYASFGGGSNGYEIVQDSGEGTYKSQLKVTNSTDWQVLSVEVAIEDQGVYERINLTP